MALFLILSTSQENVLITFFFKIFLDLHRTLNHEKR